MSATVGATDSKSRIPCLKSRERGSAVLMTLVLGVVLAGIVEYSMSGLSQFHSTSSSFRALATSDSLTRQFKGYGSLPTTFRNSVDPTLPAGTNAELLNCIFGGGVNSCQSGVEQPVTLFFPVEQTASGAAHQIMAGPGPADSNTASPARLDLFGNPCKANSYFRSLVCPFEVFATFTPACAGGAATCVTADSVSIHYYLRGVNSRQQTVASSGNQNMQTWKTDFACNPVKVSAIWPPLVGSVTTNVLVAAFGAGASALVQDLISKGFTNPDVISAIVHAGITNLMVAEAIGYVGTAFPDQAINIVTAVAGFANTYPQIAVSLSYGGITDPAFANSVKDAIVNAGVTNPSIMLGLSQNLITDSALAATINNTVLAAGFTDSVVLEALAYAEYTSVPDAQAMGNALVSFGTFNYQATANVVAKTNQTDPFIITALNAGWVGTVYNAAAVAGALTGANITNQTVANGIALAVIGDAASASQYSSYLINAGVTGANAVDSYIATGLSRAWADIPDRSTIPSVLAAVESANIWDPDVIKQALLQGVNTVSGIQQLASSSSNSGGNSSGGDSQGPVLALEPPPLTGVYTCSGSQCSSSGSL